MELKTKYDLEAAGRLHEELSSDGVKVILIQPPLHPGI